MTVYEIHTPVCFALFLFVFLFVVLVDRVMYINLYLCQCLKYILFALNLNKDT